MTSRRLPQLLLIAYSNNYFTEKAEELLQRAGLDYVFLPAGTVHPDGGSHPWDVKRVPAIRISDDPDRHIADGYDEIERWVLFLTNLPDGGLTPIPPHDDENEED